MKILFIVDYYYPYIGGAEVVHQKLAESLAEKHDVTVLTQAAAAVQLEEVINGVRVIRIKTLNRLTFPWQAEKIAYALALESDLVQVSTYSAGFLGAKIKRKLSIPVILLVHGYLREVWFKLGLTWFIALLCHRYETRLFSKKFDHYVVPSQFTANNLFKLGISKEKVSVIYHGIDPTLFHAQPRNSIDRRKLGIDDSEKVFLFSGRPSRMKGIETLLQAFKKSAAEIRLVLMLAKDSKREYQRVINFIQENKLTNSVLVIDPVPHSDMPRYLAMADVVVVPSLTEEFCFFAAETAAMQIPMVVSQAGALPEVVSGKVVFALPGSVDDWVRALNAAVNGEFVALTYKAFSWETALQKYEELYTKRMIDDTKQL